MARDTHPRRLVSGNHAQNATQDAAGFLLLSMRDDGQGCMRLAPPDWIQTLRFGGNVVLAVAFGCSKIGFSLQKAAAGSATKGSDAGGH
jgi:hypothetical protein